jgi:hypothetical protein
MIAQRVSKANAWRGRTKARSSSSNSLPENARREPSPPRSPAPIHLVRPVSGVACSNGCVDLSGTDYSGDFEGDITEDRPLGSLRTPHVTFLQTLALRGDYLRDCDFRRCAGTPSRPLFMGFGVSATSSNCRNLCSNSSTAFPKAPSCPARTIATAGRKSNDGGRNTFTASIE